MMTPRRALLLGLALTIPGGQRPPDDLDAFITREMARRHVPGLSLAIIQEGRIITARAYGVTDVQGSAPVTTSTLFQAGSISKSVAALGALHLVEAGELKLDSDVNALLHTWKVPENRFTDSQHVTLRRILSHSAGLTVHGFPGYDRTDSLPTLVQVLDGVAPANTSPIRVDTTPGVLWRYSGGGYTVMQQLIIDVTGEPFPAWMQHTVLEPLGMTRSSYQQPPPDELAAATAAGHYQDRKPVRGRWHLYPEMAAAGLWTTPSDLARFAIGVQQAYRGAAGGVISADMANQMLTAQMAEDGLGVFLQGADSTLSFARGGRDEGFDAQLMAYPVTGQGAVVMINANDDSRMVRRILRFIGRKYHWPGASSDVVTATATVSPERLAEFAGRYEIANNRMLTMVANDEGRLQSLADGFPDDEFVPIGDSQFSSTTGDIRVGFTSDTTGAPVLIWTEAGQERRAPRIGPLVQALEAVQRDPDPARTERVKATLRALAGKGEALQRATSLTSGARNDLAGFSIPGLNEESLTYLCAETVAGRGIERHGASVARILYYGFRTTSASRYLMVHLAADGLITDFDVVDN